VKNFGPLASKLREGREVTDGLGLWRVLPFSTYKKCMSELKIICSPPTLDWLVFTPPWSIHDFSFRGLVYLGLLDFKDLYLRLWFQSPGKTKFFQLRIAKKINKASLCKVAISFKGRRLPWQDSNL